MFFEFYFEGSLQVSFAGYLLLFIARLQMFGSRFFYYWLISRFVVYDRRFILRAGVYLVEESAIILREGCILIVGRVYARRFRVLLYLFQRILYIVGIDGGFFNFLSRLVGSSVVVSTRRDVVFVRVGLRSIAFFGLVNDVVVLFFK